MEVVTTALFGASHRKHDVSNEYPWPKNMEPEAAWLYSYNQLEMPGVTAGAVWSALIKAQAWPSFFENCTGDVEFLTPSMDGNLCPGTEFAFNVSYVPTTATVKEFVPGKRLAWEFVCVKHVAMRGYHTFTIQPLPDNNGVRVITEETLRGVLSLVARWVVHPKTVSNNQRWLEGLYAEAQKGGGSS